MATPCVIFILSLSLAIAQQPSPSSGLTRDFCQSSSVCKPSRSCYVLINATLLPPDTSCPSYDACRCVPPSYVHCQASSDCDDGETCARTPFFPFVCTSSVRVDSLKGRIVTIEDSLSDPLVPECAPPSTDVKSITVPRKGLVLDPCLPGTCADGLSCVLPRGDGKFQCCADGECVCHAPDTRPVCDYTEDCNNGEVCGVGPTLPRQCYSRRWLRKSQPALWRSLKVLRAPPTSGPDSGDDTKPDETSPDADDQPSEAVPDDTPVPSEDDTEAADGEPEEAVCVDAEALAHLPVDQLVFEKHRLARVLCDFNGSCATPGHIVNFKGHTMMMKSYCSLGSCVERIMRVNSVKYQRGFLASSKTPDLEYTAFAARYATRAEESMLAAAVRFGL